MAGRLLDGIIFSHNPPFVEHRSRRARVEIRQVSLDQREGFFDQLMQLIYRRARLGTKDLAQSAV